MNPRPARTARRTKASDAARAVTVQRQTAQSIETELSLKRPEVVGAIRSLEDAQRVTQDRLQLDVSV